jgi:small GTP-binding protein
MDYSLKVVIIGSENIGKSCLLSLLSREPFEYGYHPTIGADLRVIRRDGVKICIWEISGSEKFSGMLDGFVRSANIILFCYSAVDPRSFDTAMEYYNKYNYVPVKKILVATKVDLARDRQYERDTNMEFIKTSALRGSGSEKIINAILSSYTPPEIISEKYDTIQSDTIQSDTIINPVPLYKKFCCIC